MIPRKPIRKVRAKPRPGRLKGRALQELRLACFERDGYRCQGEFFALTSMGRKMVRCDEGVIWESGFVSSGHMAHIQAKRRGGDALDNVRTLCGDCHRKEHAYGPSMEKPCPPRPQTGEARCR